MYLTDEKPGPTNGSAVVHLAELDGVFAFVLGRVGNRADAEDVTQQAALKALPRLRSDASAPEARAYLYAAARSALATFWSERFRLPQAELPDDVSDPGRGRPAVASAQNAAWLEETLAALPGPYRQVLELRFLRGCSIRETALQMGKTAGAVKVMQLRALRAAGRGLTPESQSRPARRPREASRGSAFETPRVFQGA